MENIKIKSNLKYLGIPILLVLYFIIKYSKYNMFILLLHLILIVYGYLTTVSDLETKTIPNKLMIIMSVTWLSMMAPLIIFDTKTAISLLKESFLGFATGGGMLLMVYLLSKKGLGGGDVKFMALTGLYIGPGGVYAAMLIGSILAGLTVLSLICIKKLGRKDTIPLAPFLYAGILTTVFLM